MKADKIIFRILALQFLIFSFATACGQGTIHKKNHNVNAALSVLTSDIKMKNAGIGFYAVDINSGEIIAQNTPDLSLAPASTMKLLTSALALETIGKNYRFKTRLEYRGYIDTAKNVLNGDLIIRGGGDPTLGSKYYTRSKRNFLYEWAKELKKAGIDSVNGYLIADASLYDYDMVPPTWSWEDMGNYFGAGPCGLSVFDNTYTLTFDTGNQAGDTCRIYKVKPEIPQMTFDNTVTADNIRSDLSYIFGQPYTYHRYIRGRLPVNRDEYEVKGSLPDPAFTLVSEFAKVMEKEGIKIRKKATTYRLSPEFKALDSLEHTLIHTDYSPTLSYIIKKMNFVSINLVAEHLLSHASLLKTGKSDTKSAANYAERFWSSAGIDTDGMSINDGSGLSRYNAVTAKQVAEILRYMKTKGDFETLFESMPIVGEQGTVSYVCRGTSAAGNMRAKSGTIRNVRAYAGIVTSASGRQIAFSLMINNYNGSASSCRRKMEPVMAALADFKL